MDRHAAAIETEVFRDLMPLVEHMAFNATADGMPRTPGRITIMTRGVAWVVEVSDVEGLQWFQATTLSLDGALAVANALLASGQPPWQPLRAQRR